MRNIIILFLLFFSVGLSAQITVNTNFQVNSANPIDQRYVINSLGDTTGLTFIYEGLHTYVKDEDKDYFYDGTKWREVTASIDVSDLVARDSTVQIYLVGALNSDTIVSYTINNIHTSQPRIKRYEVICINNSADSILTVQIPDLTDSSYVFNQVEVKVMYVKNNGAGLDGLELIIEHDSSFWGPEGYVSTDTLTAGQFCTFRGIVDGGGPDRLIWQEKAVGIGNNQVFDTLVFYPSATVEQINAALSHAGTVVLRGGVFNLSSGPILITSDNVNLVIEGDATLYSPSGAVVDTFENNQMGDPDITFMITSDGNDNVSIIHRGVIDCVAARSPILLKDGNNISYFQEGGSWTATGGLAYDICPIWVVDVIGMNIPRLIYKRPDISGASTTTALAGIALEGVIGGEIGYLETDRVDETIDINFYCTDIHFGTIIARRPVGSAEVIDMTDMVRATFDYIFIDASEGAVQKDYAIHIKTDGDQEDATADGGSSRLAQNLIAKNLRSSRELTFKKVHIKGGDDFDNSIIRLFTNSDLNEFHDIVFEDLYVDSLSTSLLSDNANTVTLDRFKINATIDLLTGSSILLDLNDYSGIHNEHNIKIRDASGWSGSYLFDTKLTEGEYKLRIETWPSSGTAFRTRTNGRNKFDVITYAPFSGVAADLQTSGNIINIQSHATDSISLSGTSRCNQIIGRANLIKAVNATQVRDNVIDATVKSIIGFADTSSSTVYRNVINGVATSNGDAFSDTRWLSSSPACGVENYIEKIVDLTDSTIWVPDRKGLWFSLSPTATISYSGGGNFLGAYSAPNLAYSIARKLDEDYSGNVITVRRASDNTTQDIGFLNDTLDVSSMETFCSGTNCFVTTIYDQSGNSNNATQSTNAYQAQIVSSGTTLRVNGKPALDFDGTDDWYSLTSELSDDDPYSIFSVIKREASGDKFLFLSNDTLANAPFVGIFNTNAAFIRWDGGTVSSAYDNSSQTLMSFFATASDGQIYGDGALVVSSSGGTGSTINFNSLGTRGKPGDAGGFDLAEGFIQEVIFYSSGQTSNRTGIESNINAFYSIY